MKKTAIIAIISLFTSTYACKKPAGEGGVAAIKGTIYTRNYNSNFSNFLGQYPGADLDVYIIYGDDVTFGDRTKSGPDGLFEFKHLRKGNYKIYVYSKDSVGTVGYPYSTTNPNVNAPDIAVFKDTEITKRKETVDVGTFTIFD
ncbi:MAG TPA: hypothetical protein VFF27_13745 [Bacteroidia bacterium]|nr:hypothetical protein [Bacteroidia bacterium]